jgi:hypothetical protein
VDEAVADDSAVVVVVGFVVDDVWYYYFEISMKKILEMMRMMKQYLNDVLHFLAYIEMIY